MQVMTIAATAKTMIPAGLLVIASYLLGSVPFGLLIAKAYGIDLRSIGSGNIGATNLSRALGRKWGYICFVLDASKGLVPMLIARAVLPEKLSAGWLWFWLLVGTAAVLGHIFPVYLKFKGGKGVSTCMGIVLGLYPYYTIPGLAAAAVWAAVLFIWRYMSLASMAAAASFPVLLLISMHLMQWSISRFWPLLVVAVIIPILVIVRHVENIKRILEGTENKVLQKKTL